MKARPNYGLDSRRIVATLVASGIALCCLGLVSHSAWRWISFGLGMYFLSGASGMLFYSKVGCGRGLLTVGAAHRVPGDQSSVSMYGMRRRSAAIKQTRFFRTRELKAWVTELK